MSSSGPNISQSAQDVVASKIIKEKRKIFIFTSLNKFFFTFLSTSARPTLDKQDQPRLVATSQLGGMTGFATDRQKTEENYDISNIADLGNLSIEGIKEFNF